MNAPAVGADHLKAQAGVVDGFAALGQMAKARHHQPADGVVFVIGKGHAQRGVEVFDLGQRLHPVAAAVVADDIALGFVKVVFVFDVADDLLDHVFDGHQPGHAAVFVHHDGHVVARAAEFFQQHVQAFGFGDEHRRAQAVAQVKGVRVGKVAQQVFGQQDAQHIVLVAANHRKARMRGVQHEGQEMRHRFADADHIHLAARNHDVAHR